ncbi:hypothetical protein AcV7_010421 [Taiwanofungus camphoratus]|nr:hypothetical protein AcV7_010443 [Antrodia cinnamomea]KAI0915637.1 hypothetical protein AcV7_010421 [Antrodia cinnamomea]
MASMSVSETAVSGTSNHGDVVTLGIYKAGPPEKARRSPSMNERSSTMLPPVRDAVEWLDCARRRMIVTVARAPAPSTARPFTSLFIALYLSPSRITERPRHRARGVSGPVGRAGTKAWRRRGQYY